MLGRGVWLVDMGGCSAVPGAGGRRALRGTVPGSPAGGAVGWHSLTFTDNTKSSSSGITPNPQGLVTLLEGRAAASWDITRTKAKPVLSSTHSYSKLSMGPWGCGDGPAPGCVPCRGHVALCPIEEGGGGAMS